MSTEYWNLYMRWVKWWRWRDCCVCVCFFFDLAKEIPKWIVKRKIQRVIGLHWTLVASANRHMPTQTLVCKSENSEYRFPHLSFVRFPLHIVTKTKRLQCYGIFFFSSHHSFAFIVKFIHNFHLICFFFICMYYFGIYRLRVSVCMHSIATAAKDQFTYLFASHNRWEVSRAFLCIDERSETWPNRTCDHINQTNTVCIRFHSVQERKKRFFSSFYFFLLAQNAKAQTNFHNNNFKIEWNFIFRYVEVDASCEFSILVFFAHALLTGCFADGRAT